MMEDTMKRNISFVVVMLAALLASCSSGGYEPGSLAASIDLELPLQTKQDYWIVEEGMELYHYTQGREGGTPVLIIHGGPGVPYGRLWPGLEGIDGYEFH